MKRILACMAMAITFVIMCTVTFAASAWNDGVYTGSAEGHNGPITVEVTVENGAITDIQVTEHQETPFISDGGFAVAEQIISKQSLDVNTVTGATITSKALIEAVRDALAVPTFADGTYVGEAEGHQSTIVVEVVVANGLITEVNVLSQEETPFISDAAFEVVTKAIVESQTVNVDTVSGATNTSNGIIAAVADALSN